jgi:hypothetical protein
MTSPFFKDFELKFCVHLLILDVSCVQPVSVYVLITGVWCRVQASKLPVTNVCMRETSLCGWQWPNAWTPSLVVWHFLQLVHRMQDLSFSQQCCRGFRACGCDAVLMDEFDISVNRSTLFGIRLFCWTAWPWRWTLCDHLNCQQPL